MSTDPTSMLDAHPSPTALNDINEEIVTCSMNNPTDVAVGESVALSKRVSEDTIHTFATVSGDRNPLHLNEEVASDTRFDGRIAHGMLTASFISAAIANMPGLPIYLSQDLEFHNPVRIGTTCTAVVEVVEGLGGDQYRLETRVETTEGEVVTNGEAIVLVDELPENRA